MARPKKDKTLEVVEKKDNQNEGRKAQVYEMRKKIVSFSEEVAKMIIEKGDLEQLRPNERVDVFLKLMTFICPKPVERDEKSDERISQWIVNIRNVNNALGGGKNMIEEKP